MLAHLSKKIFIGESAPGLKIARSASQLGRDGFRRLRGRSHRNNLEIDQILPGFYPFGEKGGIFGPHQLVTGLKLKIDPAGNVFEPLRYHPALLTSAAIDCRRRPVPKSLDNHIEHFHSPTSD